MKFLEILNGVSINHRRELQDPWVVSQANQIADEVSARPSRSGANGRSRQQIFNDSANGLALQVAVVKTLKIAGVDVRMETERKEWDIVIQEGQETFYADIKGIFKEGAKAWGQTGWEAMKVPYIAERVLYLCFDCRLDYFVGWCTHEKFKESKFRGGSTYVHAHNLNT